MDRSKCGCGGVRDESRQGTKRLMSVDFDKSPFELAKFLLGKVLVRWTPKGEMRGVIVETEAYPGGEDKASFSYNGNKTNRNYPMFMKPGTVFVYMTYGMYHCFNISSQGDGAAILIRAIEPVYGIENMQETKKLNAKTKKTNDSQKNHKSICIKEICNGPSKLCMALDIDKKLNEDDLEISSNLWVEMNFDVDEENIVSCPRIGLNSKRFGEWATKPFRYFIKNNPYVSKKAPIADNLC